MTIDKEESLSDLIFEDVLGISVIVALNVKEFIRKIDKKIELLKKDKLNPIDYTTSRRREFNNILKLIQEYIKQRAGGSLV